MKTTSDYDSSLAREIIQLQEQLKQLNIKMGYCLAHFNRLGILTDPDSLETYDEYSCGNHYNW